MNTYLKSLKSEIAVMRDMKPHFENRNDMFNNEVSELLRKYENRYNLSI
jgi:hypothetical protein